MNLLEGLHLYEIVLLALGVVLFFVLVVLLFILVSQNRNIKPLLLFFVVPVLMIGFPAISKIKFDQNGVELDKTTRALIRNPSDVAIKAKLEKLVVETKPRATENPERLVKIARAEAVLEKPDKALHTLNQALSNNPKLETATDLKGRLENLPTTNQAVATRQAVEANTAIKR